MNSLVMLAVAAVAVFGVQTIEAQQFAEASDEWAALSAKLQPGSREIVERVDGSKVTGTFVRISGNVIEIRPRTDDAAPPTKVPLSDVKTIRTERRDSLMNGALWGLGAGTAGGVLSLCAAAAGEGGGNCFTGWDPSWVPLYAVGLGAGIGLGVGVAIDALRHSEETVYSRAGRPSPTARVAPFLKHGYRGVLVTMEF